MKKELGVKLVSIMSIFFALSTLLVVIYQDLDSWACLLLGGCAGVMISSGIMNYPLRLDAEDKESKQ